MTRRLLLAVLVLVLAACSGQGGGGGEHPHPAAKPTVNAAKTKAAELRAGLTLLLHEHSNLTAYAVQAGVANGFTSPQFEQAAKVLDQNGRQLADEIQAVGGRSPAREFYAHWHDHVNDLMLYAKGVATDNAKEANDAEDGLSITTGALAGFFDEFTAGKYGKTAAEGDLGDHEKLLTTAIDSIVKKQPSAPGDILTAAREVDRIAFPLAWHTSQAHPTRVPGDPRSRGSTVRATFTGLLAQHVAQVGVYAHEATVAGLGSARAKAATAALDDNTKAIVHEFHSVFGEQAAKPFEKQWRRYVGLVINYVKGSVRHDKGATATARQDLTNEAKRLGEAVETATSGAVPASSVTEKLQKGFATLETAVDAIAAKSPSASDKLQAAQSWTAPVGEAFGVAAGR